MMTIEFKTISPAGLVLSAATAGLVLLSPVANAAPEVFVNQVNTGSSVLVEQYSNGQATTITATPNSISMQNGMPSAVTQVTTLPRYTSAQGASTVITRGPVTSQVTQQIGNTIVTLPVNTPISTATQVLSPITTTTLPVINNQIITQSSVNSPVIATTSIDTFGLTPTFSAPNMATANTKMMKILKNSEGLEFAVPANNVAPGDVIEYHTTYVNSGTQPVRDLNATVTLPNGVKLVSLNSPLATMGTVGGGSYQTIQQVGNSVVVQENYSGLKWNLVNLAANTPQTVVIRAKVQ